MTRDIDYEIKIKFNKTQATIGFENDPNPSQFAHGIALLILALDESVEGGLINTFSGITDAIKNIKGD